MREEPTGGLGDGPARPERARDSVDASIATRTYVPSGDDGATNGRRRGVHCARGGRAAARAVLFATPHVWPHLILTPERESADPRCVPGAAHAGGPRSAARLRADAVAASCCARIRARYELEGTGGVLSRCRSPVASSCSCMLAKHIEARGLRPVIAHPERSEAVARRAAHRAQLAERGWLLQVNATSVIGQHGPADRAARLGSARQGLRRPRRLGRPPLDAARAARRRVGRWCTTRYGDTATQLFDGSALGFGAAVEPRRVAGQRA